VRPQASIAVSRLGRYDRIFEDILGHRYFMGLQQFREVDIAEASASWYDNVYKPIADLIREYDILSHFPGRTEADLYLWITARWLELSRTQKPAGPAEAIADILFEAEGTAAPAPSPQVLAVLKGLVGIGLEVVEIPGDEFLLLGRDLVLGIDRRHRAGIDACATVDALVRVDVEHPVLGSAVDDAVDRTNVDTGFVFEIDAGLGNDVGHFARENSL
jgi:hypothetical protein